MATYNGERYVKQQIDSILSQLYQDDELIISDDSSTDSTLSIIRSYNDDRIRLFHNVFHNHIKNFEYALKQVTGQYVFLSDQDDVWAKDKVKIMVSALDEGYSLVCSNCYVTDSDLNIRRKSFFSQDVRRLGGFFRNLFHNHYLGCCLAFQNEILKYAIPFPQKLITHDTWLGLVAETVGSTKFINEKLLYYRRHSHNLSCTTEKSNLSIYIKFHYRIVLLLGIINNVFFNRNFYVHIQRQDLIDHRRNRFLR